MHFKSYTLRLRRQYEHICCLLAKLEPSCKIGVNSAAIFRKVLYRKWLSLALCHSIVHCSRMSPSSGANPCQALFRGIHSHYAIPRGTAFAKLQSLPINLFFRACRGKTAVFNITCGSSRKHSASDQIVMSKQYAEITRYT